MKNIFYWTIFTFLIYLSFNTNANAQLEGQAKLDSLLLELPKLKQDTSGVNLLKEISYSYRNTNPNEGIEYAYKSIELAKELEWEKGLATGYNTLGMNYNSINDYQNAMENYNKALIIFEKIDHKPGIASVLVNKGVIHSRLSELQQSLDNYFEALKINEELNNKSTSAAILLNIGTTYTRQSKNEEALKYYFKALELYEELGNQTNLAMLYSNIGIIYNNLSNYPKALEHFLKALKINEELGNKYGIANNHGNLGLLFVAQTNYEKALDNYNKALEINKEIGNKMGISQTLGNIGTVYHSLENYKEALNYYHEALKLNYEIDYKIGIANALGNIGIIYSQQSQFDNALEYFHQALVINREIGNRAAEALTLGSIGDLYFKLYKDTSDYTKTEYSFANKSKHELINLAIKYLSESVEILKEVGDLHNRFNYLKSLSDAYVLVNNYRKAFETHKEYSILKDSVFSQENQIIIANLEAKQENELKDIEIKLLNARNEAQDRQRTIILASSVVSLFLLILLVVGIYNRYRFKVKTSNILEEKNKYITDSIIYAKNIQSAILPTNTYFSGLFPEHFILYRPKDIISGDFYWCAESDNAKFLAVVDCTGHGVPGAFMSMIGNDLLNQIVILQHITDPAQILINLHQGIRSALKQETGEIHQMDGMEVCLIRLTDNELTFAGAKRPLWFVKNNEFNEIKGDRRPIGGHQREIKRTFTNHSIDLNNEKLEIYLTSDGYQDQKNMAGDYFRSKKLKHLLAKISSEDMDIQQSILERNLAEFQGEHRQIDDITIIGIRI